MADRSIAPRPSLEQVVAIVDFMEKHPGLGLGQLRGLEGRDESKKLWLKLTRIVNNITGPTRPMKSWIKYWADKKSTVRSKVQSCGGDSNILCSSIEKKIWDLFLANDKNSKIMPLSNATMQKRFKERRKKKKEEIQNSHVVKVESHFMEEPYYNEDSLDQNHVDTEPTLSLEEPSTDAEERQMVIMEKLVNVMSEQASAMMQLAQASQASSQAMQRLAEASQVQARAIERLATTFETISASTHDVRNAIVDIDATMKRFYSTSPT